VAQFRGQARLPRFAAPRHYELRLRPDLVACTFSGSVAITVAVSASTRFLVLNAADLSINSTSIRFQVRIARALSKLCPVNPRVPQTVYFIILAWWHGAQFSQALAPTEVVFFKEDGVLVLGFSKPLPFGEGVLKMDFTGTLNDQMRGFYRRYV
jgi:puromycin-sensitive aminopeptidase